MTITDIIKQSDLETQTAVMLQDKFGPFMEMVDSWDKQAMSINVTNELQIEEMQEAKDVRKIIADTRIKADKIRKTLKADSLNYGRAVQGVYNYIEENAKRLETHLLKQEKFAELKQKEAEQKLHEERYELLKPYIPYIAGFDTMSLGTATPAAFKFILDAGMLQKEKSDKEESDRIAKEKADREEAEQIRIENKRLQDELDAKNKAERIRLSKEAKVVQVAKKEEKKLAESPDKEKLLSLAMSINAMSYPALSDGDLQEWIIGVIARTINTITQKANSL